MIQMFTGYVQKKKEQKRQKRKQEAIHIIQKNKLEGHHWFKIFIYGEGGSYGGNYVKITKDGENFLCTMQYDYSREDCMSGFCIDVLKTKQIFQFHLTKEDPVYRKVKREMIQLETINNQKTKNQLLEDLLKIDDELKKINELISYTKNNIEKKKKKAEDIARLHKVNVGKHFSVEEEWELDELLDNRNFWNEKKESCLKQLKKLG